MRTIAILAGREFMSRLLSRGFLVGTVLGIAGIVALSFISAIGSWFADTFTTSIALVGPDPALTQAIAKDLRQDYKITVMPMRSSSSRIPPMVKTDVTRGKYDAALIAYRTADGSLAFSYYPAKSSSLEDQERLRQRLLHVVVTQGVAARERTQVEHAVDFGFTTVNLNPRYKSAAEAGLAQGLVYFLLLLLYVAVVMYGIYVASGVVEEKSNRVMELMIGAVRPDQLLAGKIVGIGALALTQMLTFAIAGGVMLLLVGLHYATNLQPQAMPLAAQAPRLTIVTVPPSTLVYLLVFFLLGFFSYSTMFAGVGALASKTEDVQQSNGLMVWPLVMAYMLSIFALPDPDKPLFVWASLIPLLSPMLMFTRVATSTVPTWQIAASIGLSLVCIWGFTMLAAKLYRVGVLMYGKPLSPKEIWRALRAPS